MPASAFSQRKVIQRRLKRHFSDVDVMIDKVLCIRGYQRRSWVVLPTCMVQDRQCVAISISRSWLTLVLGGKGKRSKGLPTIKSFVLKCICAMRQAVRAKNEHLRTPTKPTAANKGRKAVFSSDDEDDADNKKTGCEPTKSANARGVARSRLARGELWSVTADGVTLTCALGRGKTVHVVVENGIVERIVSHLHNNIATAAKGEEITQAYNRLLSKQDMVRIVWRSSNFISRNNTNSVCQGGWQIHFTDANGKKKSSRTGLSVPIMGLSGAARTQDEYMDAAREVLVKARRTWNEMDQSLEDRFGL